MAHVEVQLSQGLGGVEECDSQEITDLIEQLDRELAEIRKSAFRNSKYQTVRSPLD